MKTLLLVIAFFRLGGLDFASMGAGLTGGLLGMQNAHELPDANFNIPGGGMEADQQLMQAMRALSSGVNRNAGMLDPMLLQALQQLQGIDPSGLIGAGQQAGGQYGNLAQLSQLYGGVLGQQAGGDIAQQNALRQAGAQTFGQGGQVFDAGNQVFQAGLDPQKQLHDYMQQQTVDASRAGTSARGIGMGANAAGLENDATRKFEMDWQNNQLGRMLTGFQGLQGGYQSALGGLQGMGGANSVANQTGALAGMDLSGSMGFGAQTPGFTMASAQAPIAGQQAAYSLPMDWASMFSQAQGQDVLGPQAGVMSQIYPYLGMAQQGQQAQFGANMGRDVQGNQMQQQSQYGLWGGGQSSTPFMGGNQSGAGNPMNWMGMGGGGMLGGLM